MEKDEKLREKENLIMALLGYIKTLDIDEDICKKMPCRIEGKFEDEYDVYDCLDCIREFFSNPCKWEQDEVCVNADCEHCADFVSAERCGACKLKVMPNEKS